MSTSDDTVNWPVLRRYDGSSLDQIVLPVGGLGTGTVGFSGNGALTDFEMGNRPAKGWRPPTAFFAVRVRFADGRTESRVLEGPIPAHRTAGEIGSDYPTHGLPRFQAGEFEAAYPFGRVRLTDESMPPVSVGAFNPMVPGDTEASAWPVAHFRITVDNTDASDMEVSVACSMTNFIGSMGMPWRAVSADPNTATRAANRVEYTREAGIDSVVMTAPSVAETDEQYGSMAISMPAGADAFARTSWAENHWNTALLDFWDDFHDDGSLSERRSEAAQPIASIGERRVVAAGARAEFDVVLSWNFPNRRAWKSEEHRLDYAEYDDVIVGNSYSVQHPDPVQTARDYLTAAADLEERTIAAVSAVIDTSAPTSVREAALFNLSTLRTQTLFRTADHEFFGWEGVMDRQGSCFGTCTHVWAYEFATSHLWSDIARSFRKTQYLHATEDTGFMAFRVGLPLSKATTWRLAAADGQMASLVHLYLDWRLTGDGELLAQLWPRAKRSLEFAWIPGGWDADQDGVMEGCQHNTMDVEYYGPNPQMGTWYLAALRASAAMARAMGEAEFGERCDALALSGARRLDEELFTGTHYRQNVVPTPVGGSVADGLRHWSMGSRNLVEPDFQLGDGVLVDQLVGQYASKMADLGPLLPDAHVITTLRTIKRENFRSSLRGHFNHMRGYALGDDSALLMCSYPDGHRPERPFPYFTEAMTGFEYTAATGMIQEGLRDEALEVIDAIRARFDGLHRNPFDEPECGHHYSRALASWSALLAWNDVHYDGIDARLKVDPSEEEASIFWSTGSAWGTVSTKSTDGQNLITLHVVDGQCELSTLQLGETTFALDGPSRRTAGYTFHAVA